MRFPFTSNYCRYCECHWNVHMHTQFEYSQVKRKAIDVSKQKEINNTDDAIRAINDYMEESNVLRLEIEEEMKDIHDVSAFFACILANYSNTVRNKSETHFI